MRAGIWSSVASGAVVDLTPEELQQAAALLDKVAGMSGILSRLDYENDTHFGDTARQLRKLAHQLVPCPGYRWID